MADALSATSILPANLDRKLTRGTLLKAGIGIALVVPLGMSRAGHPLLWSDRRGPAHLRRSTYLPYLNTTFRIRQASGRPLHVTLTKITDAPAGRSGEESFSLLFRGPRRDDFKQNTSLIVEHRTLGRFQLAVLPVGPRQGGQEYEAIVNRPKALSRQRRVNG